MTSPTDHDPVPPPDPGEGQGSDPAAWDAAADGTLPAELSHPESDIDRIAREVTGPEDEVGIAALWRATMALPHWWFVAVGDEGAESPAAAEVDGRLMLLAFTEGERAHSFAVMQQMIGPEDDLRAIALPPREVVEGAEAYRSAGIDGLIFDSHLTGFYIPSDQLRVVWEAVRPKGTAAEERVDEADDVEADGVETDPDAEG